MGAMPECKLPPRFSTASALTRVAFVVQPVRSVLLLAPRVVDRCTFVVSARSRTHAKRRGVDRDRGARSALAGVDRHARTGVRLKRQRSGTHGHAGHDDRAGARLRTGASRVRESSGACRPIAPARQGNACRTGARAARPHGGALRTIVRPAASVAACCNASAGP